MRSRARGAPLPATRAGTASRRKWITADAEGVAQQAQVVNGRAFYQNNGTWTDSTAQGKKTLAHRQIRFGSDEYFSFLAANPGAAAWLALGQNVDVVVNGTLVSVRE